jgi:hypothetical protein
MLKNTVPLREYLLVSESLFALTDERIQSRGQELVQEFEGLGPARTYFVDAHELAGDLPPDPAVTWRGRFLENLGVVVRTLPFLLRLRRPQFGLA